MKHERIITKFSSIVRTSRKMSRQQALKNKTKQNRNREPTKKTKSHALRNKHRRLSSEQKQKTRIRGRLTSNKAKQCAKPSGCTKIYTYYHLNTNNRQEQEVDLHVKGKKTLNKTKRLHEDLHLHLQQKTRTLALDLHLRKKQEAIRRYHSGTRCAAVPVPHRTLISFCHLRRSVQGRRLRPCVFGDDRRHESRQLRVAEGLDVGPSEHRKV